ncbi:isoleucine--tRNA ligase [Caulobacter sp. S45]|uniref:isoleucine--tRNA ligase n=1 Tax=Caulobacter sp. S45 TaxID=1641861 RepID=UPI00157708B4|nr:isoleucine--tRNA ligase [Caulobacter sp. S45]
MADDQSPSPTRDYRDTVFLPKTEFPMRAGLPKLEPKILADWAAQDLYGKMRRARQAAGAELFVLHDGPPYANGAIHIGHALNKLLKDFVVRSQFALGKDVDYVPGWDCHGLPIEWKIEEEFRAKGRRKDEVSKAEFRARCRTYADEWIGVQREQFKRLGVLADWDHRYATMDYRSEATIVAEFHKFLMSGQLYRGSKPVMWSPVERTALADAEIEYHEHASPTIWAKFPVVRETPTLGAASLVGASVVVWTTTPWTIPANRAISYGPGIAYACYKVGQLKGGLDYEPWAKTGHRLILAPALAEQVFAAAGVESWTLERPVYAADLADVVCAHPLANLAPAYGFDVPMLSGEHVTDDAGTGFVHTAPGHGQEDYLVWLKSGHREIPETVDANGAYFDSVALFAGLQIIETEGKKAGKFGPANGAVMEKLIEAGNLLARSRLTHSYPHSWRSKAPVIYRNTPQWFIRMDEPLGSASLETPASPAPQDDEGGESSAGPTNLRHAEERSQSASRSTQHAPTLRTLALSSIDVTAFHPRSGQTRIRAMVAGRPDWLISRQRAWGTPLAMFVDKRTGEPLRDFEVNARIQDAIAEDGADAWFTRHSAEFLGSGRDPDDYEKVEDILDVWFDSGSTHAFALAGRDDSHWPADLYLEGSDQARGWFQSSLLEACGTRGRAPYEAVLTHGFTLDEQGEKMSKSKGNTVDPLKVINDSGAEILRLWVAMVDYAEDQRIGPAILQTATDGYRKFRNTIRYLLGALEGFDESERVGLTSPEDLQNLPALERYVLHRLWELDEQVRAAYREYRFNDVWRPVSEFAAQELSALYFDIRKDALYCDAPFSLRRRAARTVMDAVFERLTVWLSPILPFTCEEAWTMRFPDAGSSCLRVMPETPEGWRDFDEMNRWHRIGRVLAIVTGALEAKRRDKVFGSALEAAVQVFVRNDELLAAYENIDAAEVFRTSSAVITSGHGGDPLPMGFHSRDEMDISLASNAATLTGEKCARCWRILPEVHAPKFLCERCDAAVAEIERAA